MVVVAVAASGLVTVDGPGAATVECAVVECYSKSVLMLLNPLEKGPLLLLDRPFVLPQVHTSDPLQSSL